MILANMHNMFFLMINQMMGAKRLAPKLGRMDRLWMDQATLVDSSSTTHSLFVSLIVWLGISIAGILLLWWLYLFIRRKDSGSIAEDDTVRTTTISEVKLSLPSTKEWMEVKNLVIHSTLSSTLKDRALRALTEFDENRFEDIRNMSDKSITASDVRYMICFSVGMCVTDVATIFQVAPNSIYTMRYRLRKKFPQEVLSRIEFL